MGKSAEVAGSSSARVHAHLSSWTPASFKPEELAMREARRQETHRQAEEVLERARVLDQRKRKRKK